MSKLSPVFTKKGLLVFVGIFGVVGLLLLFRSFAASPFASYEAETSTLSGDTTIQPPTSNDASASNGKYIRFGSASTNPSSSDITLPTRAAFYYPWYPETWSVNGVKVKYNPLLGYYSYDDASTAQNVVDTHIRAMDYGKINVAIASWWGPNTHNEQTRVPLLLNRTKTLGSNLKWGFYYEKEGFGNPTVQQIQADLTYIRDNYVNNPTYGSSIAKVGGKPVIFVYNADDTTCDIAKKWSDANVGFNFYIDLKVINGYATCANQPSSWHQYGPSTAAQSHGNYSYAISPGYWRADCPQVNGGTCANGETQSYLPRDPARWTQNVQSMNASSAAWKIITTFNEWGEGTAVEGASEWNSSTGYGTYLDTLHNN